MQPPAPSAAVAPVSVPMVVVDSQQQQGGANKYYAAGGRATGWVIFMCGICSIVLNIVSIVLGSGVGAIGTGIWGGLLVGTFVI